VDLVTYGNSKWQRETGVSYAITGTEVLWTLFAFLMSITSQAPELFNW
jgi:hypothetical protein